MCGPCSRKCTEKRERRRVEISIGNHARQMSARMRECGRVVIASQSNKGHACVSRQSNPSSFRRTRHLIESTCSMTKAAETCDNWFASRASRTYPTEHVRSATTKTNKHSAHDWPTTPAALCPHPMGACGVCLPTWCSFSASHFRSKTRLVPTRLYRTLPSARHPAPHVPHFFFAHRVYLPLGFSLPPLNERLRHRK